MSDQSSRSSRSDDLDSPFLFVPRGVPEPTAWMARHPGWAKFPAVMVPRGAGAATRVAAPGVSDERLGAAAAPSEAFAPVSLPRTGRRNTGGPPASMEHYGQEDPIAAYLRVNAALGRLGSGRSVAAGGGPEVEADATTPGAGSVPMPFPGEFPPVVIPDTQAEPSPAGTAEPDDPATAPVPLVDDNGMPVLKRGKPVLRPAGLDPHLFVNAGLKARQIESDMRQQGDDGGSTAALVYESFDLRQFRRGGPWDAQRIGGRYRDEYRDYATIAIGLYAAAAGMSRSDILEIEDFIARGSRFGADEEFDNTYTHLPTRNVDNTDIGYRLYQSRAIKTDVTP